MIDRCLRRYASSAPSKRLSVQHRYGVVAREEAYLERKFGEARVCAGGPAASFAAKANLPRLHLKEHHRMGRNFLAHASGDAVNVVLAAAGYNFRRLLAWLRFLLLRILIALGLAAQLKLA